MPEAEMFLIAIGIGFLVYAVRDGLADIKHEIWELRMDLRDKDGDANVQNWEKNHLRPTNMSGTKCEPCKPTQPECGDCEYIKDGDGDV